MIYTYTCPKCGWSGDRRCMLADRDNLTCEAEMPSDEGTESKKCGAPLSREEIALTARMSESWKF